MTSPPLSYQPRPRQSDYNVLLVVVDDLRADRLSAFGAERDTTPLLDRRLGGATKFVNCYSPVGWTLPGCASIITGQLPDDHGLVDHNRRFARAKIGDYLGESYYRYGIGNNGNVVSDKIDRETLERLGLKRRPAKWRFFGWDSGFDRYQWFPREEDIAPFDAARAFLDDPAQAAGERPWFFFLHSNIVHDYHMDRPYYLDVERWLGRDVHAAMRAFRDGPEIWRERPDDLEASEQIRDALAKYDAGIVKMDEQLESVLSRVDFDRTIVVFMSDHGEGFEPERGRVHHCGRLHGDLLHVPLAVWLPPELRSEIEPSPVEKRYASTIDVVPTVLTLLGDAVSGFPGRHLFDLPTHRRLRGSDRGYIYWREDCVRESYDTCRIHIEYEFTYPLKSIVVRRNDDVRRLEYNLAYDAREHDNLAAPTQGPIENFEPISFVVAVNDQPELDANLLASPVAQSPAHEWLLIDNSGNEHYESISALYEDGLERAAHDLVYFIHQDVLLPHGWERRMFAALAELERLDPNWGVLGAVGALPPSPTGAPKELRGHWCDPSGYHLEGPLPHEVESLDEQWLGVRKSRGVGFDPLLPGFHCYGIDLSLAARERGMKSYAIDAFVWHKYRESDGFIVSGRDDSAKIRRRWSGEFMSEFNPSADYVREKWTKYLPFQTTSWTWDAD